MIRHRPKRPTIRAQVAGLNLHGGEFIERPEDRALTGLLVLTLAIFLVFSFGPAFWIFLTALVLLLVRARQRRMVASPPGPGGAGLGPGGGGAGGPGLRPGAAGPGREANGGLPPGETRALTNGASPPASVTLDYEETLGELLALVGFEVAVDVIAAGPHPPLWPQARLRGKLQSATEEGHGALLLGGGRGEALFFAIGDQGSGFLLPRAEFRRGERVREGIQIELAGSALHVLERERVS